MPSTRRVALGAAIALAAAALASCGGPYIVEVDGVRLDTVDFDEKSGQLHLSGACKNKLYVVQTTSTTARDQAVLVQIQITPRRKMHTRQGMSGSFDLFIPIDAGTQRVLFGTQEQVIWQRPSP